MYPETDIPTIKIKNSRMVELNSAAPKSFDQALSSFTDEWEISRQEAEIILATGRKKEFIELAKLWGKPREMSRMILQSIPEIERKYRKKLEYGDLKTLVEKIATKNYGRISLEMAIDQCISGKSIEEVVISDDIRPLDRNELKIIVERIRKSGDIRKENIIAKVKNETNRPVDPKIVMEIYQNS
jgi:glutamyl-tRNA(Gln) amidotransferase subunit E